MSFNVLAMAKLGQSEAISQHIQTIKNNEQQLNALVNSVDRENGKSALHYAAESGHHRVLQVLLENGANANIANPSNKSTPAHSAAFYGHHECIEVLLKFRANLAIHNANQIAPLHSAADNGHVKTVEIIMNSGIKNEQCRDKKGATPLHFAVVQNRGDVVQKMIELGANVDVTDDLGQTPLIWAGKCGQLQTIGKVLIANGADANASDKNGVSLTMDAKFRRTLAGFMKGDEKPQSSSSSVPQVGMWMDPSTYAAKPTTTTPSLGPAPSPIFPTVAKDTENKSPQKNTSNNNSEFSNLFNHNVKINTTSSPPSKSPINPVPNNRTSTAEPVSPYSSIDIPVPDWGDTKSPPSVQVSPSPKSETKQPEVKQLTFDARSSTDKKFDARTSTDKKQEKFDARTSTDKGGKLSGLISSLSKPKPKQSNSSENITEQVPVEKALCFFNKQQQQTVRKEGRPVMEGHLWVKVGSFKKTWKIFWFVLEDTCLQNFANPQSLKPLKTIPLVYGAHAGDLNRKDKNSVIRFKFQNASRSYKFEAESKELKAQWIHALNTTVHNLIKPSSSPSTKTTESPKSKEDESSSDSENEEKESATQRDIDFQAIKDSIARLHMEEDETKNEVSQSENAKTGLDDALAALSKLEKH